MKRMASGDGVRREALDEASYRRLLGARAEATFFHTREWARILAEGFPRLADESHTFSLAGDRYALPLFRWARLGGLLATRHSSFPFLYGGPIPAAPQAWGALVAHLAARGGSFVVQGNPFAATAGGDAQPPGPGQDCAGVRRTTVITHLLPLPSSVEEYWERVLTTQKRNDIRRLTKRGVTIEPSTSAGDVDTLYGFYRQRMATWRQRPGLVYPLEFYRALLALGGDAVRLYVARHERLVVGGTFVCRWNGIVHYLAGYFDGRQRALRPNVLIQERIIRDAIAEGARIYDMLPSAGLANVETFKESFGGVPTPFVRWTKFGAGHRLLRRLRPSPARATEESRHG